ncbi:MAG TPA: Sec-independent protein translocase protein TatB [Candidatus Methylomirabilis sp.]|nr:Sec-independent protein translocase protein TatB [Candidatus Methylomirabilis sp.]
MFDVGFSELVVIGLIALIVLGPKRLPEVARTAGRWMGKLRRFVAEVKQDLDREIHHEELVELRKLKQELDATRSLMQDTSGQLVKGFTEVAAGSMEPTIHPNASSEPIRLPTPPAADTPTAKPARARPKKKSRTGRKNGGARRTPRR